MKNMRQTISNGKRIMIYLLAVWMLFAGVCSGESRISSAHFQAAATDMDAVYRLIPDLILSDEACTEQMIGAQTRMPQIRAIRLNRRALRVLLTELSVGEVQSAAEPGFFLYRSEYVLPDLAQGLVTTIQYIHDLDGKKSA